MNRVTRRTWLMGLFIGLLMGGMLFFLWEYVTRADDWISFPGSPHVYNNTNIGTGIITDRSGDILLDMRGGRIYNQSEATRKSTLHWLGDRDGFISASAVSSYAGEMAGFNLINGIYDASGEGGSARLTLSSYVQNTALQAMAGRKGTVGVYNYKTGEILCAISTPTYDPDNVPDIAGDETGAFDGVYVNRFIQSRYVPGSIFKIVTMAAALESVPGILDQTFTCKGIVEYADQAVTCEKVHGSQSLRGAFANSCNCAFASIAEQVGKTNMIKAVDRYQVADPLSFDGITTAKGNYNINDTAPVTFAWSCIGQHSNQINPARYMTFMGAIAGGGSAPEPYLMKQVTCGSDVTYNARPAKTGRIMEKEVADLLKDYMRNNVQQVYGDWNFPGMMVCAKSGTSELGGDLAPNAMFSGFVANEEYPLAFVVVVENGGYGSNTCVPILSKVLQACKQVLDAE